MIASLVLTAVLASAPAAGEAEAASAETEEPGFFATNWPTALPNDLHPEIYDKRVFIWVLAGATWLIGGHIWAPGLVLTAEAGDEHTDEAIWAWLTQLAPICLCGPCGPIYAVFTTMWFAPVRTIRLYDAFVKKGERTTAAPDAPPTAQRPVAIRF